MILRRGPSLVCLAVLLGGCLTPRRSADVIPGDGVNPPFAAALQNDGTFRIVFWRGPELLHLSHGPTGWSEPVKLAKITDEPAGSIACALDERDLLHVITCGNESKYWVLDGAGEVKIKNGLRVSPPCIVRMARNRLGDVLAVIVYHEGLYVLSRPAGGLWEQYQPRHYWRGPRVMALGFSEPTVALVTNPFHAFRLGTSIEEIKVPTNIVWYDVRGDTLYGNHRGRWIAWRNGQSRLLAVSGAEGLTVRNVAERGSHLLIDHQTFLRYRGPAGDRDFEGVPWPSAFEVDARDKPHLLFIRRDGLEVMTHRDGGWVSEHIDLP